MTGAKYAIKGSQQEKSDKKTPPTPNAAFEFPEPETVTRDQYQHPQEVVSHAVTISDVSEELVEQPKLWQLLEKLINGYDYNVDCVVELCAVLCNKLLVFCSAFLCCTGIFFVSYPNLFPTLQSCLFLGASLVTLLLSSLFLIGRRRSLRLGAVTTLYFCFGLSLFLCVVVDFVCNTAVATTCLLVLTGSLTLLVLPLTLQVIYPVATCILMQLFAVFAAHYQLLPAPEAMTKLTFPLVHIAVGQLALLVGAIAFVCRYRREAEMRYQAELSIEHLLLERDLTMALMYNILPPDVVEQMLAAEPCDIANVIAGSRANLSINDSEDGQTQITSPPVPARSHNATIAFADIVGFTTLASKISAEALVYTLNGLFMALDKQIDNFPGVHKVKTIGDCYMIAAFVSPQAIHNAESEALASSCSSSQDKDSIGQRRSVSNSQEFGPRASSEIVPRFSLTNCESIPRSRSSSLHSPKNGKQTSFSPGRRNTGYTDNANTSTIQRKISDVLDKQTLDCSVENDAAAASNLLRMIDSMQKTVKQFQLNGETLTFRSGAAYGPVVSGVIGMTKFSYDIWGDTVNLASRLESNGIPGMCQVNFELYDLLKDEVSFEFRGNIELKGKGSVQTWLHSPPKVDLCQKRHLRGRADSVAASNRASFNQPYDSMENLMEGVELPHMILSSKPKEENDNDDDDDEMPPIPESPLGKIAPTTPLHKLKYDKQAASLFDVWHKTCNENFKALVENQNSSGSLGSKGKKVQSLDTSYMSADDKVKSPLAALSPSTTQVWSYINRWKMPYSEGKDKSRSSSAYSPSIKSASKSPSPIRKRSASPQALVLDTVSSLLRRHGAYLSKRMCNNASSTPHRRLSSASQDPKSGLESLTARRFSNSDRSSLGDKRRQSHALSDDAQMRRSSMGHVEERKSRRPSQIDFIQARGELMASLQVPPIDKMDKHRRQSCGHLLEIPAGHRKERRPTIS